MKVARPRLDAVDHAILDLLRQNARRTLADIAEHVNLSSAPVKRRIDKLEEDGIIAGYTTVIDYGKLEGSVEAFTELRFAGTADFDEIVATAAEIAEVQEVFTTAGDPDALARIRVSSIDHLRDVVNRLRRAGSVTGTKTMIVLESWTRSS